MFISGYIFISNFSVKLIEPKIWYCVCVYANEGTPMGQTNKFFGRMVSYPIGILQKLKAIKLLSWKVLVIDLFFGYLFI